MGHRRGRGVNGTGRSLKGKRFVPIPYDMAESAAWRSLSGAAVKVYVELRRRYNGANNGDLSLSLDEGKRLLGLGKTTIKRAFDDLQSKGLLVKTRDGAWYGRRAATFRATDREHGTQPPSNDWRDWKPSPTDQQKRPTLGIDSIGVPFQDRENARKVA